MLKKVLFAGVSIALLALPLVASATAVATTTPTGTLSVTGCTTSVAGGTCPVTFSYVTQNTLNDTGVGPRSQVNVNNGSTLLSSFPNTTSNSASISVPLPEGSYAFDLYGLNGASWVLLQKETVGVSNPPCGTLATNASLTPGQSITSCNGQYTLIFQTDGNVVLYPTNNQTAAGALWNTQTGGQTDTVFTMQGDGNLVLYNGPTALWGDLQHGGTIGQSGTLTLSNSGVLQVTANSGGAVLWMASSGSSCQQAFSVSNICNGNFCAADQATANEVCIQKGYTSASTYLTYPVTQSNPGNPSIYTGNESWWTGSSWDYFWGGQCNTGGGCTPENAQEIDQVTCVGSSNECTVQQPTPQPPTLTTLTPTSITQGGTVTITGTNFQSSDTVRLTKQPNSILAAAVALIWDTFFGAQSTQVSAASTNGTTIQFTVPATIPAATYTVTVTTSVGTTKGESIVVTVAPAPPASCTFNGASVASGASVTAYQASSVAAGSSCVSQSRTCTNGTLSGTYTNAACTVQQPAAAAFTKGQHIETTNSVNVRSSASMNATPLGTQQSGAVGTVSGGPTSASGYTWWQVNYNQAPSGWSVQNYLEAAPAVAPPATCTFNTQTLASGATTTAYQSASVPSGSSCTSQTRTCTNGTLSGTYTNAACTVQQPAAAVIQGYRMLSTTNAADTASQTVSVTGGPSSANNPFSLSVNAGATYTVSVPARAGYSIGYTLCIDATTCHSQTPTSGTSATVTIPSGTGHYADLWWKYTPNAAATCTFNGASVTSGSSVTAYQASTVPSGSSCISQSRTCTNGTLSGTYTNASCTIQQPTPQPPTLTTLTPTSITQGGTVTITGTNFQSSDTVRLTKQPNSILAAAVALIWDTFFGAQSTQVSAASTNGTTIQFTVPATIPAATYTVTVTTSVGTTKGKGLVVTVVVAPPPPPPTPCGTLATNTSLTPGQSIKSCNGQYTLVFQTDGNVVLYPTNNVSISGSLWSTQTNGQAATVLTMQGDGNFVLYNGSTALWGDLQHGGTIGQPGTLTLSNIGNLQVTGSNGTVLWSSNTGQPVVPPTPAACTFNSQSVASAASVTAYQSATVAFGSQCVSQTRTCTNGTLSGTYTNASCAVQAATACTFNGQSVASGASVTAYQASSVAAGSSCVSQSRTCTNGTLSGTYTNAACTVQQPAAAAFTKGQHIETTNSVNVRSSASMNATPLGTQQSGAVGTVSGGPTSASGYTWWQVNYNQAPSGWSVQNYLEAAPAVAPPATCTFNTQTLASGATTTAYQSASVPSGSSCTSQTRTCTNGTLSGTYTNAACTVQQPAAAVIQGYRMLSTTNAADTASQTVSVTGGPSSANNPFSLSVNAGATYTVSVPARAGYSIGYTLCIDATTCHSQTPTSGTSATVTIPSGTGHYADLWWKYTPTTTTSTSCGTLATNASLSPGQSIRSCNGQYTLTFQTNGNVALYPTNNETAADALWSTQTSGQTATTFVMQGDGNLVLYNGSTALWGDLQHGGTTGQPGTLTVGNDGSLTVTANSGGAVLWSTASLAPVQRMTVTLDGGIPVIVDNASHMSAATVTSLVIAADRSTQEGCPSQAAVIGLFNTGDRILVTDDYIAWFSYAPKEAVSLPAGWLGPASFARSGTLAGMWSLNPGTQTFRYPYNSAGVGDPGAGICSNWAHNEIISGSNSPQGQLYWWDVYAPGLENDINLQLSGIDNANSEFLSAVYSQASSHFQVVTDGSQDNAGVHYETQGLMSNAEGQTQFPGAGSGTPGQINYTLEFIAKEKSIEVVWKFEPTVPFYADNVFASLWLGYAGQTHGTCYPSPSLSYPLPDPVFGFPQPAGGQPFHTYDYYQAVPGQAAPTPTPWNTMIPCNSDDGQNPGANVDLGVPKPYGPPLPQGQTLTIGESPNLDSSQPIWQMTDLGDANTGSGTQADPISFPFDRMTFSYENRDQQLSLDIIRGPYPSPTNWFELQSSTWYEADYSLSTTINPGSGGIASAATPASNSELANALSAFKALFGRLLGIFGR